MCDVFYFFDFLIVKKFKGMLLEFLKFLKKVVVVEGSVVKFECWIYVKLEFVIEWLKDDEFVKLDNWIKIYFDFEVCRLMILDIVVNDEGEYKCLVMNECGSVFCLVEFLVNEVIVMLEFKEKMKYVEVVEGDMVRFNVCVVGNL